MTGALVVGIGAPDRGDDAVGPLVARAVHARGLPGVRVVEQDDPSALVDLWCGYDLVVVVDAVRSGAAPGLVHLLETGAGGAPLPGSAWGRTGRGGTHAFGLGAAVELARALGRLPDRVVLVGIEAAGFEYGAALSTPVAASVATAVDRAVDVLTRASSAGATSHVPG